jgi:hypothetical protein
MKATLNWLGDPCIHLAIIALFVFWLFTGSGGATQTADLRPRSYECYVCGGTHQGDQACPDRAQRSETMVVKH